MGGLPKEVLIDNMVSIMHFVKNKRIINPSGKADFNDIGVKLKLCKPKSPNTKGKYESANRFLNRLSAFNGIIRDFDELIKITETIDEDVNMDPIEGIGITPRTLFVQEKEYFSPLSKKINISSYLSKCELYTSDSTGLITVLGKKYSVPLKYIKNGFDFTFG